MWHLELITGLIMLISPCRYLLTKTLPDFAESSEAANQQVALTLEKLMQALPLFLPVSYPHRVFTLHMDGHMK